MNLTFIIDLGLGYFGRESECLFKFKYSDLRYSTNLNYFFPAICRWLLINWRSCLFGGYSPFSLIAWRRRRTLHVWVFDWRRSRSLQGLQQEAGLAYWSELCSK
jgi:hypothetical protein